MSYIRGFSQLERYEHLKVKTHYVKLTLNWERYVVLLQHLQRNDIAQKREKRKEVRDKHYI